jgi:hypothetical protein
MTLLPIPGANEINLATKVGTSVVTGLRKANQPLAWPNTRDALLELLAILEEWDNRARRMTQYANQLARNRQSSTANSAGGGPETREFWESTNRSYAEIAQTDGRFILNGRIPYLAKLRASSRRKAVRRGLRTILLAYCPDLLQQFELATTARVNWVREHRNDFDHWFDESHSDDEIAQLLIEMNSTQRDIHKVTTQIREFITTNFPLSAQTDMH